MSWFDILKEEDSPNSDSLREKQMYRKKLYERERLYNPLSLNDEPFSGFRFYGALEIFSMLGRKFERKAYKRLSKLFKTRGQYLLRKIDEAEMFPTPVIELNPRLLGSGRPNEGGQVIFSLSFAGPNILVGGRHYIDIPIEEFMNIYPSGYKGYKINNTVERGDYKRVLNYLLENMDDNLSYLEVPFEILPKDTQKYIKYAKYSSIIVKIERFTDFTKRTNFVDKWKKMLKGGFRF